MRASFVERLPARAVADRFGYQTSYIHLLRHLFANGKIDFDELPVEGMARRKGISREMRGKIRSWREKLCSAGEIAELRPARSDGQGFFGVIFGVPGRDGRVARAFCGVIGAAEGGGGRLSADGPLAIIHPQFAARHGRTASGQRPPPLLCPAVCRVRSS